MKETNKVELEDYVGEDSNNDQTDESQNEDISSPEYQFEQWAEAVEQGKLTDDQIEAMKQALGELPMTNSGPQLELGADGQTAWQFFNNLGIEDDDLEDTLKKAAEVDNETNAVEVFGVWAEKNYPELLVALGMSGTPEQPAAETTVPPTGAPGLSTVHGTMENDDGNMGPGMMSKEGRHDPKDMIKEVAKIVKSFYNESNPNVGPFRGEEGILIDVEKTCKEKFGEEAGAKARALAEKFMAKLTQEWQENHGRNSSVDQEDGLARLKELTRKLQGKSVDENNSSVSDKEAIQKLENIKDVQVREVMISNPNFSDNDDREEINVTVYFTTFGEYSPRRWDDEGSIPEVRIHGIVDDQNKLVNLPAGEITHLENYIEELEAEDRDQ